jgi:hypothetical protein
MRVTSVGSSTIWSFPFSAPNVCCLEFSVQRPKRLLAGADPTEQARWRQHVYPGIKASCHSGAALVFEDEASFRQDSTLHQTGARRGRQPRVLNTAEGLNRIV